MSVAPEFTMEKCLTIQYMYLFSFCNGGWSGGGMVLGKLPGPGRPTIWMIVGQGPTALAVGAGCLDIFTPSFLSSLSLSLGDGPI